MFERGHSRGKQKQSGSFSSPPNRTNHNRSVILPSLDLRHAVGQSFSEAVCQRKQNQNGALTGNRGAHSCSHMGVFLWPPA